MIKTQTNQRILNLISILLAIVIFLALGILYYLHISGLNYISGNVLKLPGDTFISTIIRPTDVFVGLTIYLKTSVDFAILIGILMSKYPGFKNRVAIENGTAFGNMLGTVVVLTIWFFFKEVKWLLAGMVFLASMVLLEMAKTGVEHIEEVELENKLKVPKLVKIISTFLGKFLDKLLFFISPVLGKIMPSMKFDSSKKLSFTGLFLASFTIPFILGLDDFAGYVSLFQSVNVFGFGIGVFAGHCVLNILLFINPSLTIKTVKNPIISLLGSIAFIGLAFYGFFEVFHVLKGILTHH